MKTTISAEKFRNLRNGTGHLVVIDVRDPNELTNSKMEGAVNIPLTELSDHIMEYSPSDVIVFICQSGKRSLQAAAFASSLGYTNTFSLEGGIMNWNDNE